MGSIKKRLFVFTVFIGLLFLIHFLGFNSHLTLEYVQEQGHRLRQFVAAYYFFSVALYLGLFFTAVIFFIPITALLNIVAGFLYGVWFGALYAIIGTTVGGSALFLLIRYLVGDSVQRRYANQLATFNNELAIYGHYYLLMLQLFPMTPTFIINTCSGLTKLSLWTFMWTTAVGVLPGTLVYTMWGDQLKYITSLRDIASWPIIIAFMLLGILSVVPMFFRRYVTK